jgi:hypothetical protein
MEATHPGRVPPAPWEHGTPPQSDVARRARLAGAVAGGVLGFAVAAAFAAALIQRSTETLAPRGAHAAAVPAAAFPAAPQPITATAATPRPDVRHLPAASDGIYQPWECGDEKPC